MDKFLKIQNFKECQQAFKTWMEKNYGIIIDKDTPPDMNSSELLFVTMKSVKNELQEDKTVDIKTLNNIALNRLQDYYVDKLDLDGPKTLINRTNPYPETHFKQDDMNSLINQYDSMLSARGLLNQSQSIQSIQSMQSIDRKVPEPTKEEPINPSMFDKLVGAARDDFLAQTIELQQPVPTDPKSIFATPPNLMNEDIHMNQNLIEYQTLDEGTVSNHTYIIDPPKRSVRTESEKQIIINGFDRDWKNQKMRFSYYIDFNNLSGHFKSISSITFNSLIVPSEMISSTKPSFLPSNDYKFGYAYLMLIIEELPDMYYSFSEKTVQRSFVPFVFDNSYKCPNGRGYIVLKPPQHFVKTFPNNSISLNKMTFTIAKPTGCIYSRKTDDYKVIKVDYQTYNSLYIQIVLDKYFDRNEFSEGDNVIMADFIIYMASTTNQCISQVDYANITAFINRQEGHDIVELGEPNDKGYYKNFYIHAPGSFDSTLGQMTIDRGQVDAIREFNLVAQATGNVINTSLQNVINMSLKSADIFA